ncbi:Chitinase 63 [Microbacterium sp. Bi128]|nr:Chitinase 63 [Microbacterium sp. Bi128]
MTVTATGTVGAWTVSWESPGATAVTNAWGMECGIRSSTVTCRGAEWAGSLAPGQTVRVGVQMAAPSAPSAPRVSVSAS